MKATLLKTNAGKGYKIIFNMFNQVYYFYTSIAELEKVVFGSAKACQMRTLDEFQKASEEEEVAPLVEQEIEA